MKLQESFKEYPNEASCKAHFKAKRDKQGVVCKRCQGKEHYWLSTRDQYQCKACKFRTTLRSGTLLHKSQQPLVIVEMIFIESLLAIVSLTGVFPLGV